MLMECAKGCGVPLEVTPEMIAIAEAAGVPFKAQHPDCEKKPVNIYRVDITVTRQPAIDLPPPPETMFKAGGEEFGRSLNEVFDTLIAKVSESIQKVSGLRDIIEVDYTTPEKEGTTHAEDGN